MAVNVNDLIQAIQERLFNKIDTKTGWGKNELKVLILNTIIEVVTEYLDVY